MLGTLASPDLGFIASLLPCLVLGTLASPDLGFIASLLHCLVLGTLASPDLGFIASLLHCLVYACVNFAYVLCFVSVRHRPRRTQKRDG